jgi:hypothetical protein
MGEGASIYFKTVAFLSRAWYNNKVELFPLKPIYGIGERLKRANERLGKE